MKTAKKQPRLAEEHENPLCVCGVCFNPEYPAEIQVLSYGDESWQVCPDCRTVEGNTTYAVELPNGLFEEVDV